MRNTELVDGRPVDPGHRDINPETGMQRDYVVLTEVERAKGFVRPVRRSYVHVGAPPYVLAADGTTVIHNPKSGACGTLTTMALPIAETYARDPYFYSGTFCCGCRKHLPLEEFVWDGTSEMVGS